MNMRTISYFSLFLAGIIAFAGCKSDSTSTNASGGGTVIPNPGSYFIIANLQFDSTGTVVESDTTVETFFKTGLTFNGKTDVAELIDSSDGFVTDTEYINYESDGDISAFGNNFAVTSDWWLYPFASQQSQMINGDTSSNGVAETYTFTFSGGGTGNASIMGKNFSTEKVNLNGKIIASFGGVTDTVSGNFGTISFAPSLGEVVDETTPAMRDPISQALGTSSHGFVVSYMLK
jgi:hypothetical protein